MLTVQESTTPSQLTRPPVERLTVLYDADCSFCTWAVAQLRGLDRAGRIEHFPLQHAGVHPERPELRELAGRHDLHAALHAVRPDGEVRVGGGALLEILDALPGGWLLRPWALAPGVERLVDAGYRWVAARRHLFSALLDRSGRGRPACDLPAHGREAARAAGAPPAAPKVQGGCGARAWRRRAGGGYKHG